LLQDPSFIHYGQSQDYYWRGANLFSIKSFSGGQARYDIDRGAFLVDDQCYLILNHGQEYELIIQSETPVTFFCVFFAMDLVKEIGRSLTSNTGKLLDVPVGANVPIPELYQRTYANDLLLSPVLNHIRELYPLREHEPGWLTEQYHTLLHQLWLAHQQDRLEEAALPALRSATRKELYRRLYLARDYIKASYNRSVTLEEIAGIACMSPNHLLRTFKQAFGQTPHQYLTNERLSQTCHLLVSTQHSITEICLAVGFESLGSFSWLFQRRFGLSPTKFRTLNKIG
jgi:AraC family transcriptional regulator